MEKDLKHMFYWGELNHLGADGYKELIHLRDRSEEYSDRKQMNQIILEIQGELQSRERNS